MPVLTVNSRGKQPHARAKPRRSGKAARVRDATPMIRETRPGAGTSSCSPVQEIRKKRETFTIDHKIPATTFHQSLVTRRFNKSPDVFITRGIHDMFQIDDVSRIVTVPLRHRSQPHRPNPPQSNAQHVPSPTGQPKNSLEETIRLTGVRRDDPRSWRQLSNVRSLGSVIIALAEADSTSFSSRPEPSAARHLQR